MLPKALLARTFLDAISITRELGFDYIWIDSLCIIQDFEEDWVQEAAKMGSYYKNAVLNIAATGVPDGRNGFFRTRNPNVLLPHKVYANWSQPWPVTNQPRKGFYYLCSESWKNEIENSPLNRRCWVVQERVLSQRILHFGKKQIFWECPSMTACEAFPAGFHHTMFVTSSKLFIPSTFSEQEMKENKEIQDIWARIVMAYSQGNLTRKSDKLVAIAGLAAEFHALLHDEYLAGLWKSFLPRQLLWKVSGEFESVGLSFEPRAPSWSWASLDAPIDFYWAMGNRGGNEVVYATLVEAQVVRCGSMDFGPIAEGYIRIRGPLKRACRPAKRFRFSTSQWVIDGTEIQLDFYPDLGESVSSLQKSEETSRGYSLVQPSPGEYVVKIEQEFDLYSTVYLMPILSDDDDVYGFIPLHGLVLLPTYRATGEFFRLGAFTVEDPSDQNIVLAPTRGLDSFEHESYDEFNGFTIKVV